MAKLIITRARAMFGSELDYSVMVDGKCVGTVANGATAMFNIASGAHEIHVEVDAEQSFPLRSPADPAGLRKVDIPMGSHKTYSNTLSLLFNTGDRIHLDVCNSGGFFKGLLSSSHEGMRLTFR